MRYGSSNHQMIQDSMWYVSRDEIDRRENKKFITPQTKLLNVLEEYLSWYGGDIEESMKMIKRDLKGILQPRNIHLDGYMRDKDGKVTN